MRGVFTSGSSTKKEKPKNIYKIGHSIRVMSQQEMLEAKITRELLQLLIPLTGLPEDYFDTCYQSLIANFAAYVNILPKNLESGLGSLYCNSLYRAYFALKTYVEETPNSDCLWRYAVFSAALLKTCNSPTKNYQIIITDPEGAYISKWNALESTLGDQNAQFCKLYAVNNLYVQNHAILMGMTLQQIMPKHGLQWLQTNGQLFAAWLEYLQSEGDGSGALAQALEFLLTEEDFISQHEDQLFVEMIETPETLVGESIDQWIREAIENGDLKINTPDAAIQIAGEGQTEAMFIDQGISKVFARKLAQFSVSASAAVSMFYAIFGPSEQHALALTIPGTTRRGSLMSGGSLGGGESRKLHSGIMVDPSIYFGKDSPAKSTFASEAKSIGQQSLQALSRIVDGQQNTSRSSYSPSSFR